MVERSEGFPDDEVLEDLDAVDADQVLGAGSGDLVVHAPDAGIRQERDRYGAHAAGAGADVRRDGDGWRYEVGSEGRGVHGRVEDPD